MAIGQNKMTVTYSKPLRRYWWLNGLLIALMGLSGCRQQTTVKPPKQAPSGFVVTTKYAADRIKTNFAKNLQRSTSLNALEILLVVGIASWDADKMQSPYDFMNTGIKETEYDVAR